MTVQSTQLLHLAEESLDLAKEKGFTTDDEGTFWDARFKQIKNLLDPTDDTDAVTLGYMKRNSYNATAAQSAEKAAKKAEEAAKSAAAAAKSEENAKTWDPTYYIKTDNVSFWNYLHRLGNNPRLPITNKEINQLGIFSSYFDIKNRIDNQPTQYGQLINFPTIIDSSVSTQLWLDSNGKMYHRGGNGSSPINDNQFKRFLDTDDANDFAKISNGHIVINGSELWIE